MVRVRVSMCATCRRTSKRSLSCLSSSSASATFSRAVSATRQRGTGHALSKAVQTAKHALRFLDLPRIGRPRVKQADAPPPPPPPAPAATGRAAKGTTAKGAAATTAPHDRCDRCAQPPLRHVAVRPRLRGAPAPVWTEARDWEATAVIAKRRKKPVIVFQITA